MRKFIELSMIIGEAQHQGGNDEFYTNTDEPGEGGPARAQAPAPVEPVTPVRIAVDSIRCYYRRKGNRVGTRLTFSDGGGFAVIETFDEVKALVEPVMN